MDMVNKSVSKSTQIKEQVKETKPVEVNEEPKNNKSVVTKNTDLNKAETKSTTQAKATHTEKVRKI